MIRSVTSFQTTKYMRKLSKYGLLRISSILRSSKNIFSTSKLCENFYWVLFGLSLMIRQKLYISVSVHRNHCIRTYALFIPTPISLYFVKLLIQKDKQEMRHTIERKTCISCMFPSYNSAQCAATFMHFYLGIIIRAVSSIGIRYNSSAYMWVFVYMCVCDVYVSVTLCMWERCVNVPRFACINEHFVFFFFLFFNSLLFVEFV